MYSTASAVMSCSWLPLTPGPRCSGRSLNCSQFDYHCTSYASKEFICHTLKFLLSLKNNIITTSTFVSCCTVSDYSYVILKSQSGQVPKEFMSSLHMLQQVIPVKSQLKWRRIKLCIVIYFSLNFAKYGPICFTSDSVKKSFLAI